jgi:hypothetical protein
VQNDSQFIKAEEDIQLMKGKSPEEIQSTSPLSDKKELPKEEVQPVHLEGI